MMDFCPKKGKFFIFILGQYFSFFWIFVLSHIWLPRYEKTADFLAQMLFGSCIGSHWFQKLKNIQSDTQYLCKIPDIFSVSQPKCLLWSKSQVHQMIWAKTGIYLCRYNVDWYYPKKKSNEYVIIHKHKLSWNARSMANGRCCVLQKGKNGVMLLNIDKTIFLLAFH